MTTFANVRETEMLVRLMKRKRGEGGGGRRDAEGRQELRGQRDFVAPVVYAFGMSCTRGRTNTSWKRKLAVLAVQSVLEKRTCANRRTNDKKYQADISDIYRMFNTVNPNDKKISPDHFLPK